MSDPFPVEVMSDPLARFITETSDALQADHGFVGAAVLAALAGAVGTTRVIELKASWTEPAVLWIGIVARSGTLKSPSMDAVMAPLRQVQAEAVEAYKAAKAAYDEAKADPQNEGQKPPKPVRYVASDTTVEALAVLLKDNPRGILVQRDELSGWFRSANQYKGGRGSDTAAWLELWRMGTLNVDRRTGEDRFIYIPRAAASVCGTIQPGVLANVLTGEHYESGFAARLLLVHPPERRKRWSERTPTRAALDNYGNLIRELVALRHLDGEYGPIPIRLPLDPDAQTLWARWYDQHADRIYRAENDAEHAALAKIEAYAARFALLFTLADDPGAVSIQAEAIRRGIALAGWFGDEALRIYRIIGETDQDREARTLLEWITKRGGSVTVRDVTRNLRRYEDSPGAARAALADLAKAGIGRFWYPKPGSNGGGVTERFTLADTADADTTPAGAIENVGCVGVGSTSESLAADVDRLKRM